MTDRVVDLDYDEIVYDDERKLAILFKIEGKEQWVPRSLLEVDKDAKTVTVPEWWAVRNGLV